MSATISTVYAIDFLGELLMGTMLICNVWRLRGHTDEDRLLRTMVACAMVGCLMDAVSFTFDGTPGIIARLLVVTSNTFLHAAETVTCCCWALFIHVHMRGSVAPKARRLVAAPAAAYLVVLFANLFTPLVFNVDSANVYSRLPLSVLGMAVSYGYFAYALVFYLHMRHSTRGLRFFPGWALLIPVAVGGSVQLAFPQMPLFWAAVCVGIAATITSLQNEDIYRDRLTGLYNRTFLEYVSERKVKQGDAGMTGVMIDLNGFKSVNDRFGHTVGDQALVDAAHVLRTSVGDIGMTARYAGDEFVVLLNTNDEAVVDRTLAKVRENVRKFNESGGRPYRLSMAMGCCPVVPGTVAVSEFISDIDRAMYEDKRRYYEAHPEASRRASDRDEGAAGRISAALAG